jgi:hypothetical protein
MRTIMTTVLQRQYLQMELILWIRLIYITLCLGLLRVNFCVYMAYAVDKNFSSYIKLKSSTLLSIVTIYVHVIT